MIDLGAHGMYIIHWLLGMPVTASSAFTNSCTNKSALEKNSDKVEDNAVTVMSFADGTIAINETGFVSSNSPIVLEVHGELGYIRMENEKIVKRTAATNGEERLVEPENSLPSPIEQFLTGQHLGGASISEAKALTRMMEMAYSKSVQ